MTRLEPRRAPPNDAPKLTAPAFGNCWLVWEIALSLVACSRRGRRDFPSGTIVRVFDAVYFGVLASKESCAFDQGCGTRQRSNLPSGQRAPPSSDRDARLWYKHNLQSCHRVRSSFSLLYLHSRCLDREMRARWDKKQP